MILSPRLPDCASPRQRPVLVVSQITSTDEMHDGQLARPVIARESREVIVILQHAAQHVRSLSGLYMLLEHGI